MSSCHQGLYSLDGRTSLAQDNYNDVIMGAMTSQITSLTIVYSTVYSGADRRKHQSTASLAFVWGIHRWPITGEFPSQRPVTRSFDVFFDLRLNKQLSKHSRDRWFETSARSLWRYFNEKRPFRTGPLVKTIHIIIMVNGIHHTHEEAPYVKSKFNETNKKICNLLGSHSLVASLSILRAQGRPVALFHC